MARRDGFVSNFCFLFCFAFLCAFFITAIRLYATGLFKEAGFIFFFYLCCSRVSPFSIMRDEPHGIQFGPWSLKWKMRNWSVLSNNTCIRYRLTNHTVQIKAMQQHSPIIAQMVLLNDQSHNRSKLWLWFMHMSLLTCSRDWEIPSSEYIGMYVGSVYVMSIMSSW